MPFSSLHGPDELARAGRLLDAAWEKIEEFGLVNDHPERERIRLAYAIAALMRTTSDDEALVDLAVARFRDEGAPGRST